MVEEIYFIAHWGRNIIWLNSSEYLGTEMKRNDSTSINALKEKYKPAVPSWF